MSGPATVARDAITAWLEGRTYAPPALGESRPVFVSLHDADGELRGCVGHLVRTRDTLGDEIAATAVLAACEDPRFPPLRADELATLRVEVSVLGIPEPVDRDGLDPRRYGIVVRSGARRGVLLPDLDGVDTVGQQVDIACRKAGIRDGDALVIERFLVEKHR